MKPAEHETPAEQLRIDPARTAELAATVAQVREQIDQLAAAAGRPSPRLLVVTKFHPAADIAALAELGIEDIAENREQEAREKYQVLHKAYPQLRFHMIGQVQTKKANHIARWAASVHSVDSPKLVTALNRGVELALSRNERDSALPVFIQISHDGDSSRGGIGYDQADELANQVMAAPHLLLAGAMVVPPLASDPRLVFERAAQQVDTWRKRWDLPLELSAGMSADLAEAIAAGSDIVRVGTAVMGPRPLA